MSLNHEINLTIPESHFAHYGCELFVFCIDGESFKPIGSFGKDRFMLAKSNGFNVHYPSSAVYDAFDEAKDMCDHFASNPSKTGWTSTGGGDKF